MTVEEVSNLAANDCNLLMCVQFSEISYIQCIAEDLHVFLNITHVAGH